MLRNLVIVLCFLAAFIIFAGAVTGDITIPAIPSELPWLILGAAGCVTVGVLIGSESPESVHEACYPSDCPRRRELDEISIRHEAHYTASHRRVDA